MNMVLDSNHVDIFDIESNSKKRVCLDLKCGKDRLNPKSTIGLTRTLSSDARKALMKLIRDPELYDVFYLYLYNYAAEETLVFWKEVDTIRQTMLTYPDHSGEKEKSALINIYETYIKDDAEIPLNISIRIKNDITSNMESFGDANVNVMLTWFRLAQKEAFDSLVHDRFGEFLSKHGDLKLGSSRNKSFLKSLLPWY